MPEETSLEIRGIVVDKGIAKRIIEAGRQPAQVNRIVGGKIAMSPDEFINTAIDLGSRNGVASLDPEQRVVFLISEAEVECDIDGIDAFLSRYRPDWLAEAASAFEAVGAVEIATGFRAIPQDMQRDDLLLDKLNELITSRAGYDYEAIRRFVEERLSKRCS